MIKATGLVSQNNKGYKQQLQGFKFNTRKK
jgi:hypothetical protein